MQFDRSSGTQTGIKCWLGFWERPRGCGKPFPTESMVSMYLAGEVFFLFSWQNSCLQVEVGGRWIILCGSTKDVLPQVWPVAGRRNGHLCFSFRPWLISPSPRRWQQHRLFSDVPSASLSIPHSLPPSSPQPPRSHPTSLFFTSATENSLSLWVYLSGDCLTTNTSFVPFLSPGNLGFMQGCGSGKIQVQAECSIRPWLRQAVLAQQ